MAHAEPRRCRSGLPVLHLSDIGDANLLQIVGLAEERAAYKNADAGRGRVGHRGWPRLVSQLGRSLVIASNTLSELVAASCADVSVLPEPPSARLCDGALAQPS